MDYLQPIAGTPLIPPKFVTVYFLALVSVLGAVYLLIHLRARQLHITHKLKKLVIFGVAIKLITVVGIILITAYWLIPSPLLSNSLPKEFDVGVSPNDPLEFEFDRPLNRQMLEKSINPDVAGVWVFEKPIYATHLYRKVVFYPHHSLQPNTKYTVGLKNIQNSARYSNPYSIVRTFTTQDVPKVVSVDPEDKSVDIPTNLQISIKLSEINNKVSDYEFSFNPAVPFSSKLSEDKKSYVLIPNLKQGITYTLTVLRTDISWNLDEDKIINRGKTNEEYVGSFTTRHPPSIEKVVPSDTKLTLEENIKIIFTRPMDKTSVKEGFNIVPQLDGTISWEDDKTLIFNPEKPEYEKTYTLTIAKNTKDLLGGFLEETISQTVETIGPAKVTNFSPSGGWEGVGVRSPIKITFDQEVDRDSAQQRFSITPEIEGFFRWEGNTLIFEPGSDFPYSTVITVKVLEGVRGLKGFTSNKIFTTTFKTQDKTFKLSVPVYLQKHSLSCEVAALRMALAYKGISESEEELLNKVGYDPTPHNGNTWGDPYEHFVGNVDGRQMTTGYGVYWGPIARVAQGYRAALAFENWGVSELTQAVSQGHPVIIWGYSKGGVPTYWNTPGGKKIYAVSGEHTVVVVGFVGKADNPSQIIVNDPLVGQVYWSRSVFDKKWSAFNQSGVVVY